MRRAIFLSVALLVGLAWAGSAHARTERKLTYRTSQIWNSAVRFLRVDNQFKIVEKDRQTGYLLFEYTDGARTHHASLELIPTVEENYKLVRARLRIEGMPSYVEAVLMDKLLRKLKLEYGEAPPAELASKPEPASSGNDQKADQGSASSKDDQDQPKDEQDVEVEEKDLEDSTEEDD